MLSSLRRKQSPSVVQPSSPVSGRSASAEPAHDDNNINNNNDNRQFSQNDSGELANEERNDSTASQRPKSASGKGAHRLSMQLNNGNLTKITQDTSNRPATSGSGRRESAKHPHRISEEQDTDMSHDYSMDGKPLPNKGQEEDIVPNATEAWRAAVARVAANEMNGEQRRPSSDLSRENTAATDRQAALNSLMGSLNTSPLSNGSATASNDDGETTPITTDTIITTPTGCKRESAVYGPAYKTDARPTTPNRDASEHAPSPKPKSPSSPSKTTFPRGHDSFNPSEAPPVPPLPYMASQASSSQETLSHYVTPKSSFYNEREPVSFFFEKENDISQVLTCSSA